MDLLAFARLFFFAALAFAAVVFWRRWKARSGAAPGESDGTESTVAPKLPANVVPLVAPDAPSPARPARTTALDALADLDPDLRALIDVLDRCSAPQLGSEPYMAGALAEYIARTAAEPRCVLREFAVKGNGRESGARIDLVFRGRVAVEVKRCDDDRRFTAGTVQRAIGQIRKYAGLWHGPVLLVVLSPYEAGMDARLKAELAAADLRERNGGPVVAAWKWPRQPLRIVR